MSIADLPTLAAVHAERVQQPHPKGTPRIVDRIAQKAALAQTERACRRAVKARDKGQCRICRQPASHMHHLQMRSLGGKWTVGNVLQLDTRCHTAVHQHVLRLAGVPDARCISFEWLYVDPPRGVKRRGLSEAT